MNPLEYVAGVIDAWPLYAALLAVSAVLHWFLLIRKCVVGFFDPLFVVLVGSLFGWPLVWFMFINGDIALQHAVSFSLAEIGFGLGLLLARTDSRCTTVTAPSEEPPGFARAVLTASGALHVGTTLLTWALAGIPLFRASRQGAFVDSGGLGLFDRLSDACGLIALFTAMFLLIGHRRRVAPALCVGFLAWYATAAALSGSKSAMLVIGQVAFAVAVLYRPMGGERARFWGGRPGKVFIAVATLFAMAIVAVQINGEANIEVALIGLTYRLVSFGDIYIFAYVDDAIRSLRGDNPFVGLLGGFLSTFRLFPVDGIYPNIGYQLALLTFPDMDYVAGPNPRHPVFGYQFFGMFAPIFSLLLGILTTRLQERLYFARRRRYLPVLIAFLLYSALAGLSVDFDYSMSRLASMIIGLVLSLPWAFFRWPRTRILTPRGRRRGPAVLAAARSVQT